jgi:3-mercaptopyruvate sulfurtransferase SseA
MGELDAYKNLPLPSLELFKQTMKQMNIKHYDDIILYSQVPKVYEELGNIDVNNLPIVNLLGIYRAQYLLEVFGHKGNIYIMQNYDSPTWTQSGGQVYVNPRSYMNGQEIQAEDPNEYAYKLDISKTKTFEEIKKIENMRLFHEQTFGSK